MQTNILFKWSRVAGALLIGAALAWAMKLTVIISTNGRIIDTGAAALLMKIGLVLFIVGSTGIGSRISYNKHFFFRIISIILSPVLVFGSFLLFGFLLTPLVKGSGIWYAEQEAAIALAVLVYAALGYYLFRNPAAVKN